MKGRKLFFISNQTRDINGEMCLLSRYRWNLLDRRVCFTCVSLKSLTPTQYTIAPRVLALSACWKTGGMIFIGHSSFFVCLRMIPLLKFPTSCCAVMSWCSCSSPSVSAMITLAVPGRNIQVCYRCSHCSVAACLCYTFVT